MKIVIISELVGGGVERVNYLLAKGLMEKHHVLILAINEKGSEYINDIDKVVLNKRSGKRAFFDVIRTLKKERPDYIITCNYTSTVCAILYRAFFNSNTRCIFTVHSVYSSMFKYNKKRKLILQHYVPKYIHLYNWCDDVIYVSQGVKKDFKKLYYVEEKKEHVIYNPVFEKMPVNVKRYSGQMNIPIKIVTVGRLSKEKRQYLLIEAISKMLKRGFQVQLYIYGEGVMLEPLRKLTYELNVEDSVYFMGFSNNIFEELIKYDVFCLTSEFESFGNVIVEAMGVKLPVVVVDCPVGPTEILKGGEYGRLVSDNVESISDAIIDVVHNENNNVIEMAYNRATEFELDRVMLEYSQIMKDNH